MLYIKYTQVDYETGVSCMERPFTSGPSNPKVKGLKCLFELESLHPTNTPVFIGSVDGDADISVSGVLCRLSKEEVEDIQHFEKLSTLNKQKQEQIDKIENTFNGVVDSIEKELYSVTNVRDKTILFNSYTLGLLDNTEFKLATEKQLHLLNIKNKALAEIHSCVDFVELVGITEQYLRQLNG